MECLVAAAKLKLHDVCDTWREMETAGVPLETANGLGAWWATDPAWSKSGAPTDGSGAEAEAPH